MSNCANCDKGVPVLMLDSNGVRSTVSLHPGWPCHAYEDQWWLCGNAAQEIKDAYSAAHNSAKLPCLCPECGSDNVFAMANDQNACDCGDCGHKWDEVIRIAKARQL